MKIKLFFAFLIGIVAFAGCNIVNPKEGIPTYIQIDSVLITPTDANKHGSVKHKITDVWAYYDRQLLGAFELPAKIPILANGNGQLQLVAGVIENGLSGTRAKYPFLNVDTFTFAANPTNTIHYTPKFTFNTSSYVTYYVEGFEQGNTFIKRNGDTSMVKTNEKSEVFEGDWSGKIDLHNSIDYVETITSTEFSIPPNKEAFMEFTYKSDIDFEVKTLIDYQGSPILLDIISLRAKSNWTTIYFNISGFPTTYQNGKSKYVIKAVLPSGTSKAQLLFDNFKVIYFN